MTALDIINQDGTLVVSSETIAAGSGVQHKNVLELIHSNRADFEEFGGVAFETRPFATAGGIQSRHVALLNEQQATLLMTYQRNTEQVRHFKKALVRAFFDMARRVASPPVPQSLPDALRAYAEEVEQRQALEARVAEDAPKVEAYQALMDADGFYPMEEAAKAIGLGRNTMMRLLREDGVLQSTNVPYQRYLHHFKVVPGTRPGAGGGRVATSTTKVRPSGLQFIRTRLHLIEVPA
ncbi:phage regulatory protein/antirepressor Ant [Curtobacterium flaccumfaciens pv. beticola]|uniref:phage antirepressor KilAC domain-containing protein n=1 Tax=Curtobacterium flaccumfaciens TaxID=2035 RepID=UPI00349F6DDE|nr:phage regulatory protein/antirepressor Ant [Curtobacterium flaccumfaciens pv. basellae]